MTDKGYHLYHANVAIARASLDHPIMKDFVDLADIIDDIASKSPGFISQPAPPDEGSIYVDPHLLNLSVWESVESIRNFTFSGEHAAALNRREDWFIQGQPYNYVLYWDTAGKLPTEMNVKARFDHLEEHGPTPYAFTFNHPFELDEAITYST